MKSIFFKLISNKKITNNDPFPIPPTPIINGQWQFTSGNAKISCWWTAPEGPSLDWWLSAEYSVNSNGQYSFISR